MRNPESMQPTPASQTTIVVEANEVVYQMARRIRDEGTSRIRTSSYAKIAQRFMDAGHEIVRFPKRRKNT